MYLGGYPRVPYPHVPWRVPQSTLSTRSVPLCMPSLTTWCTNIAALQRVGTRSNTLQHVSVCCNGLSAQVHCCPVLQDVTPPPKRRRRATYPRGPAMDAAAHVSHAPPPAAGSFRRFRKATAAPTRWKQTNSVGRLSAHARLSASSRGARRPTGHTPLACWEPRSKRLVCV